jgi:hypothetical protein
MKNSNTTIKEAPAKTKPEVDMETLTSIDTDAFEDSYVYVHCYFHNTMKDALVRIWRTTYLIDQHQGSRSQLIHAENISYAPQWTIIPNNNTFSFLLIFSALPKSCTQFDLIEDIPMPGGFVVRNIQRNQTDVYHIDL